MAMERLMENKRVKKIRRKLSDAMPATRRRKARRQKLTLFAAGSVAGALVAYLFDPQRGKARRNKAVDRAAGAFRRVSRRTQRFGRHMTSDARGLAQRMASRRTVRIPENDAVLVSKVETEVFGNPDFPKGSVNINAEDGIITLRGQVERPDLIKRMEKAVRRVDGVLDVQNLLHLPGTPAPSDGGSVRAGRA
jgi:osmotically-inducible protein OsmY